MKWGGGDRKETSVRRSQKCDSGHEMIQSEMHPNLICLKKKKKMREGLKTSGS